MTCREWKDYLMAGNLEKVRQYINNGFDVNADIGIVRDSAWIVLFFRIAISLSSMV